MNENSSDLYLTLPAEPVPDVAAALLALSKTAETLTQFRKRVDTGANKANTDPTEAEKESGRYRKGRFSFHGLPVAIENPKGSTRSGTGADGKTWTTKMHSHYGYVERTEGKDNDPVDVFIGDEPHSEFVVAINQVDPKTKKFDEHKFMLGYTSVAAAKKCYLKNYEDGWKGLGSAVAMTMDQFKRWLAKGDMKKPVAELALRAKRKRVFAAVTMTSKQAALMPMAAKTALCPECGGMTKSAREIDAIAEQPHKFVESDMSRAAQARPDDRWCQVCAKMVTKHAEGKWIYSCCGKEVCAGCPEASTLLHVKEATAKKPAAKSVVPAKLTELARDVKLEGGYGTVFYHPEDKKVWFQVGDWHGSDVVDPWVNKFNKVKGVSEVEVEHESAPSRDKGWIRVFHSYGKKGPAWHDSPPKVKVSTVAVDLDGTLAKKYDKYDADSIPGPRPGAKKAMQDFKDRGYRVIIFTVRGDEKLVRAWLKEHDIPFDYVNENPDQPEDASDKVLADVYIDDRAVPAKQRWSLIQTEVGKRIKQADDYPSYEIFKSDIHGHGSKAQRDLESGAYVGTLANRVGEDGFGRGKMELTRLGIFINYGPDRNIELRSNSDDGYDVHTTAPVAKGDEFFASDGYAEEYDEMEVPDSNVLTNGTVHGEENFEK